MHWGRRRRRRRLFLGLLADFVGFIFLQNKMKWGKRRAKTKNLHVFLGFFLFFMFFEKFFFSCSFVLKFNIPVFQALSLITCPYVNIFRCRNIVFFFVFVVLNFFFLRLMTKSVVGHVFPALPMRLRCPPAFGDARSFV